MENIIEESSFVGKVTCFRTSLRPQPVEDTVILSPDHSLTTRALGLLAPDTDAVLKKMTGMVCKVAASE